MDELRKKDFIVFHDDEQGVAIVTLAALLNSLKVVSQTEFSKEELTAIEAILMD